MKKISIQQYIDNVSKDISNGTLDSLFLGIENRFIDVANRFGIKDLELFMFDGQLAMMNDGVILIATDTLIEDCYEITNINGKSELGIAEMEKKTDKLFATCIEQAIKEGITIVSLRPKVSDLAPLAQKMQDKYYQLEALVKPKNNPLGENYDMLKLYIAKGTAKIKILNIINKVNELAGKSANKDSNKENDEIKDTDIKDTDIKDIGMKEYVESVTSGSKKEHYESIFLGPNARIMDVVKRFNIKDLELFKFCGNLNMVNGGVLMTAEELHVDGCYEINTLAGKREMKDAEMDKKAAELSDAFIKQAVSKGLTLISLRPKVNDLSGFAKKMHDKHFVFKALITPNKDYVNEGYDVIKLYVAKGTDESVAFDVAKKINELVGKKDKESSEEIDYEKMSDDEGEKYLKSLEDIEGFDELRKLIRNLIEEDNIDDI